MHPAQGLHQQLQHIPGRGTGSCPEAHSDFPWLPQQEFWEAGSVGSSEAALREAGLELHQD